MLCTLTAVTVSRWYVNAYQSVKVKVAQSCPTLCDPMDYTDHGILQAKILEWVAIPFSGGSSQLRDQTQVSCVAGRFFTTWATREALIKVYAFNRCSCSYVGYNSAKLRRPGGCSSCCCQWVKSPLPSGTTSYSKSQMQLCSTRVKGSQYLRVFLTANTLPGRSDLCW